jgi:Ca2+:H+ antiporter
VLTYVAGLFFSLRTHKDLFNPDHAAEDHVGEPWWVRRSVIMFAIAGVAVGVMSEILSDRSARRPSRSACRRSLSA